MKVSEKDIFVPVINRDLRKSYPELAKIPEFKDMRSLDIKFCWYYAIYFSDEVSHKKRVLWAIEHSYRSEMDKKDVDRFIAHNFPDNIKNAIKKFESFDVSSRVTAKLTSERTLANFEKLARTDVDTVGVVKIYNLDDNETEEEAIRKGKKPVGEKRDWNQVNSYVNSMVKVNESLPGLVTVVEQGFGISISKGESSAGESIRDDFQRIKEEQAALKNK